MKFEEFTLERNQSLFKHKVDYNLSKSGIHPLQIKNILKKMKLIKCETLSFHMAIQMVVQN